MRPCSPGGYAIRAPHSSRLAVGARKTDADMPKPLDPAKREAIAQAIRDGAGVRSAGNIAREHGVGRTTVLRIAEQDGIDGAWDRTKTVNATRAAAVDMAAGRAALAQRWLAKANEALDRSEAPCVVYSFSGTTGEYSEHTLPTPPASEYRSFVTAAAVATDKLVALVKYDATSSSAADGAKSMLGELAAGLGAAYELIKAEESAGANAA